MFQPTEYDLIQAVSGVDENGYGKCTISLQPQRQDAEGNVVNTDDEYVTEKPVVKIFKQAGGYFTVDLIFESLDDIDLHRIYSYFHNFFLSTNSVSDDELDFPLLVLSIFPKEFNGEYWLAGINPLIYSLTPDDIKGEPKILRLLFIQQEDNDNVPNFLFLQSNKETLEKISVEENESFVDSDVVSNY